MKILDENEPLNLNDKVTVLAESAENIEVDGFNHLNNGFYSASLTYERLLDLLESNFLEFEKY
ncbi:MAG: hypothetical protein ABIF40_04360 [archaeon]